MNADPDWIHGSCWIDNVEPRGGEQTRLGQIFFVTEDQEDIIDAILTKGREIGHLDRLCFESSDFTHTGNAILQRHENLSPDGVPERLRVDNILTRHPLLNSEQAIHYKTLMLKADFTYRDSISYLDSQIRKNGYDIAMSWLEKIAHEMEACAPKDDIENVAPEDIDMRGVPALYGFHKIDTTWQLPEEKDYLATQPKPVQRLLTTPNRCQTLEQLTKLGKACYDAEEADPKAIYQQVYLSLTNKQQQVFWTNYELRKRAFSPAAPQTDAAVGLYAQITCASQKALPGLKRKLWRIQKGDIRIRDPPHNEEWSLLWNAVLAREYQFQHPLPQIPEDDSRCGYCYKTKGKMYRPKIDLQTGKLGPKYSKADGILHCLTCDGF